MSSYKEPKIQWLVFARQNSVNGGGHAAPIYPIRHLDRTRQIWYAVKHHGRFLLRLGAADIDGTLTTKGQHEFDDILVGSGRSFTKSAIQHELS
jgi:hypothetical protein